jgi:nicotinamidase-related amidase
MTVHRSSARPTSEGKHLGKQPAVAHPISPTSDYLSPERANSALVTIDMQRDFTLPGGSAKIGGTLAVVPAVQRLVQVFRDQARPIVHMVRLYKPDGSNVDIYRRACIEAGRRVVMPGTLGAELVDALKPAPDIRLDPDTLLSGRLQELGPNEWAAYKPRWGAFYRTPLEDHLRRLGVTTVVIAGCNFPNCPRATIYEASERDFRIVLVTDAVSAATDPGLAEVGDIGVYLMASDQCQAWLTHGREAT